MADRYCVNCGTEVDDDARFCPTCGQTLLAAEPDAVDRAPDDEPTVAVPREEPADEPASTFPAAPSWPPVESSAPEAQPEPEPQPTWSAARTPEPEAEPAEPAEPPPPPPPRAEPEAAAPAAPAPSASAGSRSMPDLPFTWPLTIGGWLVGAGSGLAALSLLPRLGNPLDLLLFIALLGITATVFLADRIPQIGHQRLIVLVVLVLGLGVALERAAFTVRGIHTVFLITMLAAAGGALLIELGRDRPVPPPGGAG